MKRVLLSSALLATIFQGAAIAQDSCGLSYTVLPDGSCWDMSYLTTLTHTRRGNEAINAAYSRQFNANVQLEMNPYFEETEEERDARYLALAETSIIKDESNAAQRSLESEIYILHGLMLDLVSLTYGASR